MSSRIQYSDPVDASAARLTAGELERQLDDSLNPVLSSRRTAQPLAQQLAPLPRAMQEFALHWVKVIARTSGELAYQFAALAPDVLPGIDAITAEAWIINAVDAFDGEGLYRGSAELKDADAFVRASRHNAQAVAFDDASNVLSLFICGLAGRPLKLEASHEAYTDTEVLHLPARISAHALSERNFLLYKAMATHLWAQARYGTFNVDPLEKLANYADPAHALALYHYFETTRIDAIIARELPGLARDLATLRDNSDAPAECGRLSDPGATAADSLALVRDLYGRFAPTRLSYMGTLRADIAQAVRSSRIAREKKDLQAELARLLAENPGTPQPSGNADAPRYAVIESAQAQSGERMELTLDGSTVKTPGHVTDLLQSIAQDLGTIPDEYLVPAADAPRLDSSETDDGAAAAAAQHESSSEAGAIFYNEWDYQRRHYRKKWCVLREVDIEPGDPAFIRSTLSRYALQVRQLRRTFEMLRGEDRWLKRQQRGDDIDLDAVINAFSDMRCGMELPAQLFQRRRKTERDIAVMFMVDMSGSTKGWINDAEREALVMLCEALEVLGDRYAIYGFSGITRKRCEIFRIKRFDDRYDEAVRRRIAGIAPQDYTRMGVAIRHLTALLNGVDARTKLLITLSDGKPDDYSDNYRGEYGIEDTRQALMEAHRGGIHPFCLTIDREARDYLPRMYGAVNYTVIEDVARLPLKVADVYRRLTT